MEKRRKMAGGDSVERTRWYKDPVFYQIRPRSFKDDSGLQENGFVTRPYEVRVYLFEE